MTREQQKKLLQQASEPVAWRFDYCGRTPMVWFGKPTDGPMFANVRPLYEASPAAVDTQALLALIEEIREEADTLAIDEGRGPLPLSYYVERYRALATGGQNSGR